MYKVTVKFEEGGKEPVLLKKIGASQTLLEVCLKHGIALRHLCGGVCYCTTCHLYVEKGTEFLEERSRREKDFISRAAKPELNSRLACQSLLLKGTGEIEILIPDQKKI